MIFQSHFTHLGFGVLFGVFGLGIFTIFSEIYCRVIIIRSNLPGTNIPPSDWTTWLTREMSTAIIVGNLYYWWPILKKLEKVKTTIRTTVMPLRSRSSKSADTSAQTSNQLSHEKDISFARSPQVSEVKSRNTRPHEAVDEEEEISMQSWASEWGTGVSRNQPLKDADEAYHVGVLPE